MPAIVIVGGQYGSEGKGKIAAWLAPEVQHAVRTGGPNAGHTVVEQGRKLVLRHLPCALVNPDVALYLGAGSIIDPAVLAQEMRDADLSPARLMIDPNAVIISPHHLSGEAELIRRIGSTGKGVGAAVAAKVLREEGVVLAKQCPDLQLHIGDVAGALHRAMSGGESVLLEGTQGTGLSLHHGPHPFVTSRDITAGSLCGEAGIGPRDVSRVVLVVRSYPIRVAGPSGPLRGELTWDEVTARSGYAVALREYTTVTGKLRRVGEFDMDSVVRAVRLNSATEIALTFADYIDSSIRDIASATDLTGPVLKFVEMLESATGVPVSMIGTGPETSSIIVPEKR